MPRKCGPLRAGGHQPNEQSWSLFRARHHRPPYPSARRTNKTRPAAPSPGTERLRARGDCKGAGFSSGLLLRPSRRIQFLRPRSWVADPNHGIMFVLAGVVFGLLDDSNRHDPAEEDTDAVNEMKNTPRFRDEPVRSRSLRKGPYFRPTPKARKRSIPPWPRVGRDKI